MADVMSPGGDDAGDPPHSHLTSSIRYASLERSTKNKANRGKAKYSSLQRSKNFSAMRYDEDKLVELRQTQQTRVASSDPSVDEHAIAKEVFRERRGHVRGVGRVPKSISPSLDLTAASKAP
ncbi:Uncharacterized protein Adt_23491 [Abeliophyllum distichum]|uniref:Uncharacterized protein n=1 Tax=Abeliophyllum distichum TaxID=126358 RepID=A0ABD1SBU9_9LAMI